MPGKGGTRGFRKLISLENISGAAKQLGGSARHMEECHARRCNMVHMMGLRQIRNRTLSECALHIDADAAAAIVTDENSADFCEVHRAAAWFLNTIRANDMDGRETRIDFESKRTADRACGHSR
jgi:hypothetical protein